MNQSGNAIIMILIAIALFAALGYAFSNTSRTSSAFITDAEAEAYANQIIAYGNEVKSAVKRLQLRGCSDTEISFENTVVAGYINPNSPADKSCHVFDIAGGGLQWKTPGSEYYMDFIGNVEITKAGTDCNDDDCVDLIQIVRLSLTGQSASKIEKARKICTYINKALDNDPSATDAVIADDSPGTPAEYQYKGSFVHRRTIDEPLIYNKSNYCASITASTVYSFHQILISR